MQTNKTQQSHFFSAAELPWGWRERASTISADNRSHKLDLGAGIMRHANGSLPVFQATRVAAEFLSGEPHSTYLPPTGLDQFNTAIAQLILGPQVDQVENRTFTIQTIGGANALRLAGDCLVRLGIASTIYVSNESWADHRRIFERAGMSVKTYEYYSSDLGGVDTCPLIDSIRLAQKGSVILLQASCHNPTGCDLSCDQWEQVFTIAEERRLLPLFDVAYPGFGNGLREDLWPVQRSLGRNLDFLVASSCCKLFSLYDARVGALTAVLANADIAKRLESQIKTDIQASYSSPPRYGAAIVAHVLQDPVLAASWQSQLDELRLGLSLRRSLLTKALNDLAAPEKLLRIANQLGLFAWTELDRSACKQLAEEFAIYIPSNGRICVGAIPECRVRDVAEALVAVSIAQELNEGRKSR